MVRFYSTGVGESETSTNDALYTRIKPDILHIAPLNNKKKRIFEAAIVSEMNYLIQVKI